jgi:hypothetical protein
MAIMATAKGEARKLVPAGKYFGVCVGVYDIGTQASERWEPSHKIILEFELHRKNGPVKDEDGKPLKYSGFYPLRFGKQKNGTKAKLRQVVEGILGRNFTDEEAKEGYDVTLLLDAGCRMHVVHETADSGTKYEEMTFTSLDEDDPRIRPESDGIVYELDPEEDIPSSVPEWIAKQVKKSVEWTKVHGSSEGGTSVSNGNSSGKKPKAKPADDEDDDIAF